MAKTRKSPRGDPAAMSGISDFLKSIFGPSSGKPGGEMIPAPPSYLPAAIPAEPRKKNFFMKLRDLAGELSTTPPQAPSTGGPLAIFEHIKPTPPASITSKEEQMSLWETMFGPAPREEAAPSRYEMVPAPRPMMPAQIEIPTLYEIPPRAFLLPVRPQPLPPPVPAWAFPAPGELADRLRVMFPDLGNIFRELSHLRATSDFAESLRSHSRRGLPLKIPIVPVFQQEFYTDFSRFYGVPMEVLEAFFTGTQQGSLEERAADEQMYFQLVAPLNQTLTEAFELIQPPDLPGFFIVDKNVPVDDMWWLFYVDIVTRLPGMTFGGPHG